MICEKCGNEKIVAVKNGVEYEYCYECRVEEIRRIASLPKPEPAKPSFPKRELPVQRIKSKPWTPAPIAKSASGSPSIYVDPLSGGVYDPDADKSLGRDHYGVRYYSKRVSDVDKSANKNNPLYYQIPQGESYPLPEHKPVVDEVDYGLELLRASFKYVDADGELRYNTKWIVRKLKSDEV
mgnify:CR=1 FL=1